MMNLIVFSTPSSVFHIKAQNYSSKNREQSKQWTHNGSPLKKEGKNGIVIKEGYGKCIFGFCGIILVD